MIREHVSTSPAANLLPPAMLEVHSLSAGYGRVEAVRDVSLRVGVGQIIAIVGANGAGKSTLLNALMGTLASQGEIVYSGGVINSLSVEERVFRGISLVPETRELFPEMSVRDNLALGAFTEYCRGRRDIEAQLKSVYERFPRLLERREQNAMTLSGGERQMLAIGRALLARPRLLLLDEPSLGLAPLIVKDIFNIIAQLRSTGVSILLVEQNARAALQIADYAYVMENGAVSLEGDASDLAQDPKVVSAYLGGGRPKHEQANRPLHAVQGI